MENGTLMAISIDVESVAYKSRSGAVSNKKNARKRLADKYARRGFGCYLNVILDFRVILSYTI